MTEDQKAAYVIAMAACTNAEIAAMQLENQLDVKHGHSLHHTPHAYPVATQKH